MRLSRPEWLLLPLFLLPLVAAGVLCLYAKRGYETESGAWDRNRIEAWLAGPDSTAELWDARFHLELRDVADALPFRLGSVEGRAVFTRSVLGDEPWRFAAGYPGGYSLASDAARLAVETGTARLSGHAATEFVALLEKPDLPRLRDAPLPPGTKRFLARRWRLEAGLLREVELLCEAAALAAADVPVGIHPRGGWTLLATKTGPLVTRTPPDLRYSVRHGRFLIRYDAAGPAAWRGRLEAPLAGEWSVAAIHATWGSYVVAHPWTGPVAAGLLAFLLLPAVLFVVMRKQRHLDEARARFVTEIAHDLRTPLTSVRLHAEMLASDRGHPDRRADYVDVVARESARLSGLLANLLDLSRLERGSRSFDLQPLALAEAVHAAVQDFGNLYPARRADVTVDDLHDLRVRADPTALERCLANLLDNAGKFTEPGTPIRIDWRDGALGITDAGRGVPATERCDLFRRYARGRVAQRDGVPGTGMGLALVRELAEGMGGSVAYTDAAPGARFELRLKRA